jgi:hypothetical protein
MMLVDKNVLDAINLIYNSILIKINRIFWVIRFHPKNPITNLIVKFKYQKIVAELQKELTTKHESSNLQSEK